MAGHCTAAVYALSRTRLDSMAVHPAARAFGEEGRVSESDPGSDRGPALQGRCCSDRVADEHFAAERSGERLARAATGDHEAVLTRENLEHARLPAQ